MWRMSWGQPVRQQDNAFEHVEAFAIAVPLGNTSAIQCASITASYVKFVAAAGATAAATTGSTVCCWATHGLLTCLWTPAGSAQTHSSSAAHTLRPWTQHHLAAGIGHRCCNNGEQPPAHGRLHWLAAGASIAAEGCAGGQARPSIPCCHGNWCRHWYCCTLCRICCGLVHLGLASLQQVWCKWSMGGSCTSGG